MTADVSGEDQPDPRLALLNGRSHYHTYRELLAALDAADRAAGIRRVTEPFCGCEHPRSRHWSSAPHACEVSRCECNYYEQQGSRL